MIGKRIRVILVLLLFLIAGVLYSTDRNQDFFVQEASSVGEEAFSVENGSLQAETAAKKQSEEDADREGNVKPLRVHVCGAVRHPGVYMLDADTIVADAIEQAGGFRKGSARDYLNLAAMLSDGEKVYVPYEKELKDGEVASEPMLSGTDLPDNKSSLVNINTADEALLTSLTGIGSARAQAIISWRTEHGAFASIEDIMQVSGIKEGAFEKIKDHICVS